MPPLPVTNIQSRRLPDYQTPQIQPNRLGSVFEGVGEDLGRTFQKIQNAADAAEEQKLVGEHNQLMQGAYNDAKLKYGNPDEFEKASTEAVKTQWETAIKSGRNDSVNRNVEARLADNYGRLQNLIQITKHEKLKDKAKGDLDAGLEQLSTAASLEQNDENKKGVMRMAGDLLGKMRADDLISENEKGDRARAFIDKVQQNSFYNGLDLNPSQALKDLNAGKFGLVEGQKKYQWTVQANTAIRQGITDQERMLEIDKEKADLNLQRMIDGGATPTQINAKLKEYTAVGIYGLEDRDKIGQRLLRPIKGTPQQVSNGEKLLADFNSDFPTPGRVSQFRARANQMRDSGEIDDKGAATITGHLNQVQQALIREGRAAAADDRRENPKVKVTAAEIAKKLGENYPYQSPTNSKDWSPEHRADVKAYGDATFGQDASPEEKAAIASKIAENRAKTNKIKKEQADQVKNLSAGEQAALKAARNLQQTKAKETK